MLVFGSRSWLEDWARRVKLFAAVSTSEIVKEIRPAGVSSGVVTLAIVERLGRELVLFRTKTVKLRVVILLEAPPSFTVMVITEVPATAPAVKLSTAVVEPLV